MADVRQKAGVPVVADFASTTGTPIVIDSTTGLAYCLAGGVVTQIGGSSGITYPGAGLALSTGAAWSTSVTDNSANWNTAYTERHQWDGGATNLVAATGRTSLGLGTLATQSGTFSGTSSGTNSGDVTLAGTPTYITISGQVITRGNVNLTNSVTGVLPTLYGGAGYVTPEMFGAAGDGTTDDTTALTNAMTDGTNGAIATGKPLLLGNATYKTTSQITVTMTSKQRLRIIGMPTTEIDGGTSFTYAGSVINFVPSAGTPYFLQVKGSTAAGENVMVELESFTVYCNGSVATGGIKIGAVDAGVTSNKHLSIKDVVIANASYYGLHIVDSRNIQLDNLYLDAKDNGAEYAVLRIEVAQTGTSAGFCGDIVASRCQFVGNGTTGTHTVELAAAGKASGTQNVLAGIHFNDCVGYNSEYTVFIADTLPGGGVAAAINDIFIESCAFDQSPVDPQCLAAVRVELNGTMNDFSVSDTYINSYQVGCVSIFLAATAAASNISIENCFMGRTGPTTSAGAFITGAEYLIASVGTTDFTLIGAASNTVGLVFTATGAGTGSGTAARTSTAISMYVTNGGTVRGLNITDNQLNDIALQPDGVGNGAVIFYVAGNVSEFNISDNNYVLNKTMGATLVYPPDWLLQVATVTTAPDYGVITSNVGRWQQGAHYTGTITNNAVGNNLTRTGNTI